MQSTVALGSCEAEFYAGTKARSFELSLREVMRDWGLHETDLERFTDSNIAKSLWKDTCADEVPVDTVDTRKNSPLAISD